MCSSCSSRYCSLGKLLCYVHFPVQTSSQVRDNCASACVTGVTQRARSIVPPSISSLSHSISLSLCTKLSSISLRETTQCDGRPSFQQRQITCVKELGTPPEERGGGTMLHFLYKIKWLLPAFTAILMLIDTRNVILCLWKEQFDKEPGLELKT